MRNLVSHNHLGKIKTLENTSIRSNSVMLPASYRRFFVRQPCAPRGIFDVIYGVFLPISRARACARARVCHVRARDALPRPTSPAAGAGRGGGAARGGERPGGHSHPTPKRSNPPTPQQKRSIPPTKTVHSTNTHAGSSIIRSCPHSDKDISYYIKSFRLLV